MPSKIAIKKDPILLRKANHIFGDIIENAYVCKVIYPEYDSEEDISYRLDQTKYDEANTTPMLDIDSTNIRLDFTNGKKVYFISSEWTTLSNTEDREVYEVE